MAYVVINAITVPEGRGDEIERRFAQRAGEVSKAAGFESFQFLRPDNEAAGERYLVYTRWTSKSDFDAWMSSRAFTEGHARSSEGRPVGTASEVWGYEVVQHEGS